MLTDDATEKTLNSIIKKYYENKEKSEALKEIFSDVVCHVNPHHGTITNKSYIWAEYVMSFSYYKYMTYL